MSNIPHDSATKHVSGQSVYIDDILVNSQLLTGRVVYSKYAKAKIKSIDVSEAKALSGVYAVLTHKDIPGRNQMGPVVHDEVCLAAEETYCIGQAVVLIAAANEDIAIEAERLVRIDYDPLEPILDIQSAIK